MAEASLLRRPLLAVGVLCIVLLAAFMGVQAVSTAGGLLARQQPRAVAPGWIVVGVRAPESAGGVVALRAVGAATSNERVWSPAAVADMLNRNDAQGLQRYAQEQLGAPVSGAMLLDRLALAGLVDAVGGVRLAPSRPLLQGTAAADYALADATGRHLLAVWRAVCAGLPADDARVRGAVVSLGSALRATEGAATVTRWLSEWRATV